MCFLRRYYFSLFLWPSFPLAAVKTVQSEARLARVGTGTVQAGMRQGLGTVHSTLRVTLAWRWILELPRHGVERKVSARELACRVSQGRDVNLKRASLLCQGHLCKKSGKDRCCLRTCTFRLKVAWRCGPTCQCCIMLLPFLSVPHWFCALAKKVCKVCQIVWAR